MNRMKRMLVSLFCALPFVAPETRAAPETYTIDNVHSQIMFFIDHLGFSKPEGEFHETSGQYVFDREDWSKSSANIRIHTDSLDLDDEEWNSHIKGEDFFNVGRYPTMTFRSTKLEKTGESTGRLHGNLTMLAVTRPVTIDITFNKAGVFPGGQYKSGFSGTTRLKRSDFGMTHYVNAGLGDEIEIRLEIEGVRQ